MIANELLLDAAPGDRIRFAEEVQAYTIQARSARYLVCTKPFNPKKTVLYTIVDLHNHVRGPENLVFGAGAETPQQCEQMVERLSDDVHPSQISHRNNVAVKVVALLKGPKRFCGFCHRSKREGLCSMCVDNGKPVC